MSSLSSCWRLSWILGFGQKLGLSALLWFLFFSLAWKCWSGGLLITKYLRGLVQSVFFDLFFDWDGGMILMTKKTTEMRWRFCVRCHEWVRCDAMCVWVVDGGSLCSTTPVISCLCKNLERFVRFLLVVTTRQPSLLKPALSSMRFFCCIFGLSFSTLWLKNSTSSNDLSSTWCLMD